MIERNIWAISIAYKDKEMMVQISTLNESDCKVWMKIESEQEEIVPIDYAYRFIVARIKDFYKATDEHSPEFRKYDILMTNLNKFLNRPIDEQFNSVV